MFHTILMILTGNNSWARLLNNNVRYMHKVLGTVFDIVDGMTRGHFVSVSE